MLANINYQKYEGYFVKYIIFFFTPIIFLLLGIGVMVFFDMFSGMAVAKKKKEEITSAKMHRTFTKFFLYSMGIISTRLIEIFLQGEIHIPFASLMAGFIILIEYKSLMENISIVTGTNVWEWVKEKISEIYPKNEK